MVADSKFIEDCDRSFVGFGLSSNDCTHLYLHESRNPLFEIVEDGQGPEFIRLRNGNEYRSSERRQYGAIVRHIPDAVNAAGRRWVLVTGLGAMAETGAGWYLSQHWRTLAKRIPSKQDFIAVVSVGSYSDRTPRLEEALTNVSGGGAP
jgi:hypothetical protein